VPVVTEARKRCGDPFANAQIVIGMAIGMYARIGQIVTLIVNLCF